MKKIFDKYDIDLICIANPTSIGYFTGFFADPHERYMLYMIDKNMKKYLVLPALDKGLALSKVKDDIKVIGYFDGENPFKELGKYFKIGIDTENISYYKVNRIKEYLNCNKIVEIDEDIKKIRLYKSKEELEFLQISAKYADMCIEIAKQNLREGMTELELKSIIENEIKKEGIEQMSFETIVLFGENSANPHGSASNRKLKKDDNVLLDLGVYYKHYASDLTRVLFFGDFSKYQKVYDIVLKANTEAIKSIKIGMKFSDIDKIARDIITKEGYGEYFLHRLGHGIGLDCHEYPDVSQYNDMLIEKNMVFTIEPGIYLDGNFGIRIEDDVYVSENGAIVLTKSEK